MAMTDSNPIHTLGRWRAEIPALMADLGAYLGQPVELVNVSETDDAFSCLVSGPAAPPYGFQLAWEAVLSTSEFEGRRTVNLTMFLYSRGERIRLAEHEGSYIWLTYEGPLEGGGTWRDHGWFEDGFGEYEGHDRWGPTPGT
jgi:hypothetical protein